MFGSCGQPAHAPESDVVHQQLAVMTRDRWKMHEWNKRGRPQAVINDADFQTETFGRVCEALMLKFVTIPRQNER